MIFTTENQLKELGDKLPVDKKAPIEAALQKLKDAHKAQDVDAVDAAMTELNTAFQAASADMDFQTIETMDRGCRNYEANHISLLSAHVCDPSIIQWYRYLHC